MCVLITVRGKGQEEREWERKSRAREGGKKRERENTIRVCSHANWNVAHQKRAYHFPSCSRQTRRAGSNPKRFKWGWTENLFAFVKFQHTLDFFQLRNLKCARRKGSTHCVQMSQRHAGIRTMSPGFSNLLCGFHFPADRFDLCTFSMWQIEILEGPRGSPPMPLTKLLSSNHYITISLSRFSASLALLLK